MDSVEGLSNKFKNINLNKEKDILNHDQTNIPSVNEIDEKFLTFNIRDDHTQSNSNINTNYNQDEIDFINSATARNRYVQNLKIDDLMESNVNMNSVKGSVNGMMDVNSNKLIGNLAKNNNDFKFKIEELENFALKMYNELPNHRFMQKLQKDIILINQNISSQNEKNK